MVRLTLEREGLGGMVRVEASLKRAALFEQGYRGVPAAAVTDWGYHPGTASEEGTTWDFYLEAEARIWP